MIEGKYEYYKSIFVHSGGDIYLKNIYCLISSIIGSPVCFCKKHFKFEANYKEKNKISIKWNHLLCKKNRTDVAKNLSDVIEINYINRKKASNNLPIILSAHCHGAEILSIAIKNLIKKSFEFKNTIIVLIAPMTTNETSECFCSLLKQDKNNKILFLLSPFDLFVKNSDISNQKIELSKSNFFNFILFPHIQSSELELISKINNEKLQNQKTEFILFILDNNTNLTEISHDMVSYYSFKKNLLLNIIFNFNAFANKRINLIINKTKEDL